MRKWHLLTLQIFAAVCSYLIISITGVAALEIRIFTSGGQELAASMAKFSDLIQKDFSYPYQQNYQYIQIKLSSKNLASVIKKVYLFRCKTLNPSDCIGNGIEPVISSNSGSASMTFDETYKWDDVSTGGTGNFLIMVKIDAAGKEIWTASWDKITKTGINTFNRENYESDRIDLYLAPGVTGETVKSYIENYNAIPSDNMNKTLFASVSGSPVSKIYDLSGNRDKIDPSGTGVPSFYSSKITGTVFNRSYGTWDFVFATDGKTANPAIFYSTTAGPQSTGGASLVVDNWSPQVVTCFGSEVINVDMHAVNASMGYYQSYYYSIGGVRAGEGTMTCSLVNPNASVYSYQCSIPVSTFPVCSAPGTATVNVYFNYQGGVQLSGSFPVTLKTPAPRLVVSSLIPIPFDCGIDKELTARLSVSNPSGAAPKISYTFDGKNFNNLTCAGSGEGYTCAIADNSVCQLLQENLALTFKFMYGDVEVLSLPANVLVTFPPPSLGIDTVTPQSVEVGKTTSVNVLLHMNYPDFMTYNLGGFNYKYLNKDYKVANCSLETSYSNIKYYKCSMSLEIPADKSGVETLAFRLDGFKDGKPHQLTANSFIEILPPTPQPVVQIISTSSPLKCIQDPSLTITARVDNIQGTPATTYSVDSGKTYKPLACSASGNLYTCTIAKDDLCNLMSSSLTLLLKFAYPSKDVITSPQNIYITLPEPHMQVYSLTPDTLAIGEKNQVTVNLFVQEPKMVGANPVFTYSYLSKASQKMTCTKVSSTSNRDFYECANVAFDVPADYAKTEVPVIFAIQGTTISFPMNIPAGEGVAGTRPWLEIISTTPSRIEVDQGNQTEATFHVNVNNAAEAELKHQASVVPNKVIASGTCKEASVDYNFDCDVVVKTDKTTQTGPLTANLTLRVTGTKNYDISNTTLVYVIAEGAKVDIQSVNPETLYCEGNKQQNPETVKVTGNIKSLSSFAILEEDMSFNGQTLAHTAKYCTQQAQSITCDIPTDKLFEGVTCGSGELAPGAGTHYYPLTLTFLVRAGEEQIAVSGSKDIAVAARPLEPYLDIVDSDVVGGMLQSKINCLGSQSIKLGDSGYVRIMYADLLHAQPKADDLTWSFKLEAQDDKGKLTKGMGTSPDTNATVCRFITYQKVGVHRIEDYECSLYMDYKLFQRCETGEGQITLTATSGGKKAEGTIDAGIIKDDSKYQFDFDIVTSPTKSIECQIPSEGKNVPCSLASESNQNVTIRIYNRNTAVGMADLDLYDFDVAFKDAQTPAGERSLGNCQKNSKESDKYLCPFQIGPIIKLPDKPEYLVTNSTSQKELPPIEFGSANITIYVKYAGDLERKALSKLDGSITITPKKTSSLINSEAMKEKMAKSFNSFKDIFKWLVLFIAFCGTCMLGNEMISGIQNSIKGTGKMIDVITGMQTAPPAQPPATPALPAVQAGGKAVIEQLKQGIDTTKTVQGQAQAAAGADATTTKSLWNVVAVIVAVIVAAGLIYRILKLNIGGDTDKEKSDITKNLQKGIQWGFITCVLPRIVGEIGGWIATKNSDVSKYAGVASGIGKGMANVCKGLVSLLPLVMSLINFYMGYLRFEMCMEMVQMQAEMSSQYVGTGADTELAKAQQATATAQAGIGIMNSMMGCFNDFMNSMTQLSRDVLYINNFANILGSGRFVIIYSYRDKDLGNSHDLTGGTGTFSVKATNVCNGNGYASIGMTVSDPRCGTPTGGQQITCNNNIPAYSTTTYVPQQNPSLSTILNIGGDCPDKSTVSVTMNGPSGAPTSDTFTYYKTGTPSPPATTLLKDGKPCTGPSECVSNVCCSCNMEPLSSSDRCCEAGSCQIQSG